MKKILTGLFLTGTLVLASAQTISFDKTTFDYGTVKSGADGHRFFVVKNTGDKPLIISKVQASCGCTTPEWSQDPIMPGKTAQIKVGYNTTIVGAFTKIIEVFSNDPANGRTVINIKGTVEGTAASTSASLPETVSTVQSKPAMRAATLETLSTDATTKKTAPAKSKKMVKKAAM
jgi:hypothetical protein